MTFPVTRLRRLRMNEHVRAIILFGIPEEKDEQGTSGCGDHGIVQEAVRAIRREVKEIVVTDVCLCEYTSHGHCGLVHADQIRNDATVEVLAEIALSHVKAGADMIRSTISAASVSER